MRSKVSCRSHPIPLIHCEVLQRHYRKDYRNAYQLYFMIGADAFLDILSWKSHQDVLRSVHIILSRRKGYKGEQLADLLEKSWIYGRSGLWHGR